MTPTLPSTELLSSSKIEIHYKRPKLQTMQFIKSAEDAEALLRAYINPNHLDLRECFWVILLSNANRVLGISEVAQGTTLGVQTNPKYIFQLALLTNASALIVAHPHPSGSLVASKSDIKATKKLQSLAKLMEMTLLDHIILTSESYLSFMEDNLL